MKSVLAIASLFAASVLAQGSVVTDAFSAISAATTKLDNDINAYSGGSVSGLQADAAALISAINSGNSAVSAISTLSQDDAFGLVTPIGDLANVVNGAITDAIAAKSTFDDAGVGYMILTNLMDISDATNTFSATVISKVPTTLQPTAQMLAQPILDDLQRGITAYQGEKPSTGTTTTGSTGPTTTTDSTGPTTTTGSSIPTTTGTMITTTTSSIGTVTPLPPATNTTAPLMPFNAASVPTAAAAYGVIVLAAMGAAVL